MTPNLFKDLLPLSKGEKVFRQNFGSVLPLRDQHGRRHFLIIAGNWDPGEVTFDEAWSALYKTIELISLEPKTQARVQIRHLACSKWDLHSNDE